MIKYRPDIDGLRAIAVVSILLFHTGFDWISGGFVGVDIFFVISGFLISSIIKKDIDANTFSFREFYLRRIRRIIPMLLVVLLCSLVVGYYILLPDEYMAMSRSSLAALGFFPNIYFWLNSTTYFGLDIVTTPLLHTWSLGVEEQFYLLFPACFLALIKFCKPHVIKLVILGVWILSLALSIYLVDVAANSKLAFYLLPTRLWELLTGVLLTLNILPGIYHRLTANIFGWLGMVFIFVAMFSLDDNSSFPGMNAVLPVFGAALLIHAGSQHTTLITRFLANKLFVGIGLISYSLYLWHWPVTVFTTMYSESGYNSVLIITVSLILSCLSYRYIETPFRKPGSTSHFIGRYQQIGVIAVLLIAVSVSVLGYQGFPKRIPESASQLITHNNPLPNGINCRQFTEQTDIEAKICQLGDTSNTPSFVLWGDSHAKAMTNALHLAALDIGKSGVLITSHGCRPLLGVYRKGKRRCLEFNNLTIQYIQQQPQLQHIFLAGYWRVPFNSYGYDNSNFLILDDQTQTRSAQENRQVFYRGMQRTLEMLNDRNPVIIQDIPEIGSQFGKSVANHYVRRLWKNHTDFRELVYLTQYDEFDGQFKQMMSQYPIKPRLIEVINVLCPQGQCPLRKHGRMIYSDGDHLSRFGSSLLAPTFLDYFQQYNVSNQIQSEPSTSQLSG